MCKNCCISVFFFQNSSVIHDSSTPAHLDALIVNVIRGTVFRNGCLWILGRRAAVSQIPSQFMDVVTEIQGFRCVNCSCLSPFFLFSTNSCQGDQDLIACLKTRHILISVKLTTGF